MEIEEACLEGILYGYHSASKICIFVNPPWTKLPVVDSCDVFQMFEWHQIFTDHGKLSINIFPTRNVIKTYLVNQNVILT